MKLPRFIIMMSSWSRKVTIRWLRVMATTFITLISWPAAIKVLPATTIRIINGFMAHGKGWIPISWGLTNFRFLSFCQPCAKTHGRVYEFQKGWQISNFFHFVNRVQKHQAWYPNFSCQVLRKFVGGICFQNLEINLVFPNNGNNLSCFRFLETLSALKKLILNWI